MTLWGRRKESGLQRYERLPGIYATGEARIGFVYFHCSWCEGVPIGGLFVG